MSPGSSTTCAWCDRRLAGDVAYCRVYRDAETLALCSAACARAFLAGPAAEEGGHAETPLQRQVADWRWKCGR